MSNSTNTELVDTLTDVFLTWLQNDVIPVCVTMIDVVIIILGVILNSILMVTFKQRGLMNEASTYFVLVLGIVDCVSYVFILLPTIITAIAGEWLLSEPICQLHGAVISLLMFANFTFLSILAIERALTICNVEKHDLIFERRRYVHIITGLTWFIMGLLSFLPVMGLADIKYEFYHQGCMLDYEGSPAFLLVNFMLTVALSIIIFAVAYGNIFNVRRHALIATRNASFTKQSHPSKTGKGPNGGGLPAITEAENEDGGETSTQTQQPSKPETQSNKQVRHRRKGKKRPESPSSGLGMMFEIFCDDHENPAFHLSVTYVSLWACILLCYLPYFIVAFYGTYNDGGLWRGFYTVTLLVSHLSFVVKPFIYLGHNRHYRSVTKETVPEAMKKRARSVRSSISGMAGKLEDFVFRSPANKGFGNVLATHKAVLIWKTRMRMKKQNMKSADNVVKAIKETPNETDKSEHQTSSNSTENGSKLEKKVSFQAADNTLSNPATPSGVNITTSSFIENERQRHMAGLKGINPVSHHSTSQARNMSLSPTTGATHSPELYTPPTNEDIPGMVGGNDVTNNSTNSVSPFFGQSDQLRLI